MRRICFLILIGTLSAGAQEKIDFHEAIARALKKSPDYDVLTHTEKMTQLSYKNSWSVFLPEFDLTATHGFYQQGGNAFYNQTTPLDPWSNLLGLSLTENLYDNGKSWNEMDVADLNDKIAKLSLQRGFQQLILTVAKAFYDFSSAAGGLELQKQEIETLRQQFHIIEGRYHHGVNSDRDFLRIKAQVQRSEIDLATQEIAAETTRQALRLAIGESSQVDFIPLVAKTEEVDVIRFPEISPEATFEFRIATAQDRISDIHYREVQREDWPRLTLQGMYSYNIPQYIGPVAAGGLDDPYWNLQATLVLNYAIWDWGIRRRNVEIADHQRQIEKDGQAKTRLQVQQDLNRLGKQTELYKRAYRESTQTLHDEERVYFSLNQGYRDSKVTYLELITALGDLYSIRNQYVSLQFNLLKTRANFAYYEGNLNEILNVH